MKDFYSNEVSTSSHEVIEGIDLFTKNLLQYLHFGDHKIFISDKSCSLTKIYLAVINLFQGKKEFAKEQLSEAEKLLENSNEREKMNFDFTSLWFQGDLKGSIEVHRKIAKKYPKDIISVYICYQHYIFLGDMKGILELIEIILPSHQNDPYVYSMYCFALEEARKFKEAEYYGLLGVKLLKDDEINPWSHHSVCHVYDTTAELDKGIKWMENYGEQWDKCNNFMKSHNWWHLSLLYLEKGDNNNKEMLEIFENQLWKKDETWRQDPSVLVGIIGLLWRMELKGQKLFVNWDEIVDYVKPLYKLKIWSFFDIHFIYSFARKGDTERVSEILENLDASSFVHDFAKSISFYGMNELEKSLECFPNSDLIWNIGGSNAQRAVFEMSYLDILQKNKEFEKSKTLLQRHLEPKDKRFSFTIRRMEYDNLKGEAENSVFKKWLNMNK